MGEYIDYVTWNLFDKHRYYATSNELLNIKTQVLQRNPWLKEGRRFLNVYNNSETFRLKYKVWKKLHEKYCVEIKKEMISKGITESTLEAIIKR